MLKKLKWRISGWFLKLLLSAFLIPCSNQLVYSDIPSKKATLQALTKANSYFMKKWPDPGARINARNVSWPSNIWTRAVYYEGLMELYKIDPQPAYTEYAINWGKAHHWGLRGGVKTVDADNQCCGQTYLQLFQLTQKPEMIQEIRKSIDLLKNSPRIDYWTWIDALQMAMPVFAQLAVLYNDNTYYDKMHAMFIHTKTVLGGSGLYNPTDRLWWRDKDFIPPFKTANGKSCYWSRGNGWVVAALVRVLDLMPAKAPNREVYEKNLIDMLHAIVELQRNDGFWNVSLHDPDEYGGKELTGTALFTYGMAWGVNKGLLDSRTFLPVINKAWRVMVKESLHKNGFLGYVQGTGKQPSDSQPVSYDITPDFEDFGLGCFLLAGTEVYKLGH